MQNTGRHKTNIVAKIILLITLVINTLIFADGGSIKVISPNGGEKLQINTFQGITWASKNIERINISYSIDGGDSWNAIFKNLATEIRVISWKIPNLIDEQIIIKIENSNGNESDISDSHFTVSNSFSLKGSLNKISSINATTSIMPLGNSITHGLTLIDTLIGDIKGYRFPLYNSLLNAGVNFTFTGSEHAGGNFLPAGYDENAGFSGISDDQLATLMKTGRRLQPFHGIDEQITPGPFLDTYPADIILLHIGTNGNNSAGGTNPDDVEDILDEIKRYEDSTATEITVILARIIDRVPNQSYVNTFNNNIETMALDRVNNSANDAYPDKIIIVDMQDSAGFDYTVDTVGTVGNGIEGDMSDALHPNEKGYYKMADLWFEALTSILITAPVVTIQPQGFSTVAGKSVQFNVGAAGTKPFTYKWNRNGTGISGAIDSVYQINSVTTDDNNASFSCTISNSAGNKITNEAILFVAGENKRVNNSLQVLYNFESGGSEVLDISGVDVALDLTIENDSNVKWVPYGLEVITPTNIYANSSPDKIIQSCKTSNEITIEAWIKANNLIQNGPARIITFSKDSGERNFTLGQDADKFNVRLTTTTTSINGEPALSTDGSLSEELTHVLYTRDSSGISYIYINGVENSTTNISGDFSIWDSTFSFGLANEFTTDRNWLGTYYLTAIYGRALSSDEAEHNYIVGFSGDDKLLFAPTELVGTVVEDTLVNLSWNDNSDEELGYILERKANSIDSVYYTIDTLSADITSYTDSLPKHTTSYLYRTKAYNTLYVSDYSDSILVNDIVSDVKSEVLLSNFKLYQNYPNPFNPSTTITYSIPKASKVSLVIYDILGKVVEQLIDNSKIAKGSYNYKFNTLSINSNLTSGVYFYRLVANPIDGSETFMETRKLLLMK